MFVFLLPVNLLDSFLFLFIFISLSVLFTLSSRVDSDWIAAMDIIHPVKRNDDILVALSSTGYMKVCVYTE